MRTRHLPALLASFALLFMILVAPVAQAATPLLDTGSLLDNEDPYGNVPEIKNVFGDAAVYGKLSKDTPVDIYKFTPDRDGDQSISLLVMGEEIVGKSEPVLIMMDPTSNNQGKNLGLPAPSADYQQVLLKEETNTSRTFTEPALFQQYRVFVDQRVSLTKDKTYYLIVFDQAQIAQHYTIYFGDTKNWGFTDLFKNAGSWWKLKLDIYGGSSPYAFNPTVLGHVLFGLGFAVLLGFWIVQQIFSLRANRSKSAAYLLVKLQPFSRIAIWVSLWLVVIGAYVMFTKVTWAGMPFVMVIAFLPALVSLLVETIVLSPQIAKAEVSKKEAVIDLPLRKKLFACFVVTALSLATTLVYASMFFTKF